MVIEIEEGIRQLETLDIPGETLMSLGDVEELRMFGTCLLIILSQ